MSDLTTIDPTQPLDTELASLGASRIREERAGIVGFAGLEHFLTGVHMFPNGTTAARPAPGNSGRLYLNTEHGRIERDNGSIWKMLHAMDVDSQRTNTGFAFTAPINLMAHTFDVAEGTHVLFLAMTRVFNAGAATQLNLTTGADGVVPGFGAGELFAIAPAPTVATTAVSWGILFNLSAGSHNTGLTISAAPGALTHIESHLLLAMF